ncbi:hypothetical protein [Cupriavidus pauculus]|uniref:hypothetical protein n=1 Tax=Cupriavidus pauculus TaxID=82633 RepID=UPI0011AF0E49|nr:hypothetical protein [Cupriavidus pauculus]
MMRTVLPLLLAALAVASPASAAWAAGRPPRDTSVGCARADNQYCRMPGAPGAADDSTPGAVARQPLHSAPEQETA